MIDLLGGDEPTPSTFEECFIRLFAKAERVASRIVRDPAVAEDIAAEAMTRALARWPQISQYQEPWVTRVATNLAIDHVRRRRPVVADVERRPDDDASVRASVGVALRHLPRRQREVIALRYLVGFDDEEVAEVLGVSQNTVKTHLRRGLAHLRDTLEEFQEVNDDVADVRP